MKRHMFLLAAALVTTPIVDSNVQDIPTKKQSEAEPSAVAGRVVLVDTGAGRLRIKKEHGDIAMYEMDNAPIVGIDGRTLDIGQLRTGDRVVVQVGADRRLARVTVLR